MIKVAVLALVLAQVCSGVFDPDAQAFAEFMQKYNKQYSSDEETQQRFQIFKTNLQRISDAAARNPLATFGITKFMDLSAKEFAAKYLNADVTNFQQGSLSEEEGARLMTPRPVSTAVNPINWDWSMAGAVTPVYNEGECGAPWVFSPVETVESYWALAGHPLVPLSAQQVIDCDTIGVYGCNGGYPTNAFQYIQQNGLESAADYPFNGEQGVCEYDKSKVVAKIKGFVANVTGGEKALYKQLSNVNGGPISVCVDATDWEMYTGGILTTCTDQINHCAVITGYFNYGQSQAYWNVRNDWGADWGLDGYIRIAIGHNLCGIADWAQYPIV